MPGSWSMNKAAVLIAATLASAIPATAAPKKPAASARDSAERFSLDLAPADEDASVAEPAEPAPAAPAETSSAQFGLDTPIGELLADYRSKKVLDRDMPGLSTDKNLDKLKSLSLKRLAPLSGGRLSPDLLEKVGKHLAEIE